MNIGRLLDAFENSPHRENTIIVLWGDHGWHFGEKDHWRKFALWEEATRAPLIWVVPGVTKPGSQCEQVVDFMTIYPTLCDLAGISVPAHVEGTSLRLLLDDPSTEWETPALTTYGFRNHAIRTNRWRFIRYADGSEELYDHSSDPYEWTNLANDPKTSAVRNELARWYPETDAEPRPKRKGE
ncbi:MAG: sulfatase-like hydrolase/transferase [Planctomycetaceae bacterium]